MKKIMVGFFVLILMIGVQSRLDAAARKPIASYLPALEHSEAYQQFSRRPISDFSKLIYLIDRFGESDFEILYEGHYFKASFAANFCRWFLAKNYKNEPLSDFIMNWCNRSFLKKELIWVKLPDGEFRLGREVLQEELNNLDAVLALPKT